MKDLSKASMSLCSTIRSVIWPHTLNFSAQIAQQPVLGASLEGHRPSSLSSPAEACLSLDTRWVWAQSTLTTIATYSIRIPSHPLQLSHRLDVMHWFLDTSFTRWFCTSLYNVGVISNYWLGGSAKTETGRGSYFYVLLHMLERNCQNKKGQSYKTISKHGIVFAHQVPPRTKSCFASL